MTRQTGLILTIGSLSLATLVGCDALPWHYTGPALVPTGTSGSVMNGVAVPAENQPVATGTGSLLGAGSGWIIGQRADKTDRNEAEHAAAEAQKNPATSAQARQSATADLNKDGFVTIDEVVAMRDAGLDDQEIVRRLRATGQVFQLTGNQEDALINQGVDRAVVDQIRTINPPTTGGQPSGETTRPSNNVGSQPNAPR